MRSATVKNFPHPPPTALVVNTLQLPKRAIRTAIHSELTDVYGKTVKSHQYVAQ